MSLETEKEIVIIKSQKSEESFEKYKNKTLKIVLGVLVFCVLFALWFAMSDDEEVIRLGLIIAILDVVIVDGIFGLIYLTSKTAYNNIFWIVTNQGLTQINRKTGIKIFIPTNHISSVMHVKDTVQIITINAQQPMALAFLKNASELKRVLDNLIYKTEKQKEVVVLENTDSVNEIKKYKDLLDSGIITQEEFDTKKKQILDL